MSNDDAEPQPSTLSELGEYLGEAATELMRGFDSAFERTHSIAIDVEFGAKLSAKAKFVFVEGNSDAHIKVKVSRPVASRKDE